MPAFQISAKDLGWLNTDAFCPRCFWIQRHDRSLPYQTPFAGIFSSIDSYTKNVVSRYFERNGKLPGWLSEVGSVKRLVPIKPSGFRVTEGDVTFTGIPDEFFQRQDGSYGVLDYKTARYTGTQDTLMPVYEVQLNGYAYIAESLGQKPVRDLYLVYFEPPHRDHFDEITGKHTTNDGFEMPFVPNVHKVAKNTGMVKKLLDKAARIYNAESMPEGLDGCEECSKLERLIDLADRK